MFEILMFLFESYFDLGSYPDSDKLSVKLTAAGFDNDDINLALTWLSGLKQLSSADYPAQINESAIRCYAALETKRISVEALRFLIFWEQSKIISPVEREMIIDRAVSLERDSLPLDKVKLITLMILWNSREVLDPMLIEELLAPVNTNYFH